MFPLSADISLQLVRSRQQALRNEATQARAARDAQLVRRPARMATIRKPGDSPRAAEAPCV